MHVRWRVGMNVCSCMWCGRASGEADALNHKRLHVILVLFCVRGQDTYLRHRCSRQRVYTCRNEQCDHINKLHAVAGNAGALRGQEAVPQNGAVGDDAGRQVEVELYAQDPLEQLPPPCHACRPVGMTHVGQAQRKAREDGPAFVLLFSQPHDVLQNGWWSTQSTWPSPVAWAPAGMRICRRIIFINASAESVHLCITIQYSKCCAAVWRGVRQEGGTQRGRVVGSHQRLHGRGCAPRGRQPCY